MADEDEGNDNYIGKIENKDGCVKMFGKKELWLALTNFTMTPKYGSINVVEGESQYHIFECRLKNGSTFTVPFSIADLDTNASVCAILQNAKLAHGGSIDKDKITRGGARLNRFLLGLIEKYKNSPAEHSPAIVMKNTGFITLNIRTISGMQRTVEAYVTGPDSLISLKEADDMALDLIPRKWIGNPSAEKFKIPLDPGHEEKEYIKEVMRFHGKNRASPLAALGYAWLSLHKRQLHKRGIKVGVCHIVGKISTGKSTLRHMLEFIMAHVEIEDGGEVKLVVKEDSSLSVHNLLQMVAETRHLIIQDPPSGDPENHNDFLDMYYEGKIEVKGSMKRFAPNAQPSSGLLYIWAHEKATLPKLSVTAITKSVVFVHQENPYGLEEYNELEKAWRAKVGSAPRLFRCLIQNIDLDRLQNEANDLVVKYVKELSKNYSLTTLNESNRMLKQYAFVQIATEMFVEKAHLDIEVQTELHDYFVHQCIPYMLQLIDERKPVCNKQGTAEEELIKKIKQFSKKQFLCNVGIFFIDGESQFGFPQALYQGSPALKEFIISLCNTQAKKRVLHTQSSELWFKRQNSGQHTYGQSKGIQQHICPVSNLPNKLKRALLLKCQDIIDETEVLHSSDNLKEKLDEHFNGIYLNKKLSDKDEDGKLLETLKKLTKEDKKKLMDMANDMIRKRKADDKEEDLDSSVDDKKNENTPDTEMTNVKETVTGPRESVSSQEGEEQVNEISKEGEPQPGCSTAIDNPEMPGVQSGNEPSQKQNVRGKEEESPEKVTKRQPRERQAKKSKK